MNHTKGAGYRKICVVFSLLENKLQTYAITSSMVRLKYYYKEGCWLCDTAEDMLNGLAEKYALNIEKANITSNDALYELYRFDIPVFEFKDGTSLHGRIKKKDLLAKLEANKE